MKVLVLLLCTAVLALTSTALHITDTSAVDDVAFDKHFSINDNNDVQAVLDFSDDEDDNSDVIDPDDIADDIEIDGIQLKYLSPQEIKDLLEDEDSLVISELDIFVTRKTVKHRQALGFDRQIRNKRSTTDRCRAAQDLFRNSQPGDLSRSGTRLTRQYVRRGSFGTANRDFDSFMPDNVRSFSGRISGRTGTMGEHHITVRDGSSSGEPTLEIRSPVSNPEVYGRPTSTFVRKFRYINDRPTESG